MLGKNLVLVTDFLSEVSVEAAVLEAVAEVRPVGAHGEDDLAEVVRDANALIVYHDIPMMTDATFARAPRLRGVVRAGVGFNNIDIAAASRRGIIVCNVPDYGTEEVADHTILLLLAVVRRLLPADDSLRKGQWDLESLRGTPRLRGKVLGLIGCGRIGTATALRAKVFGLDVVFYDPYAPAGLEKALGVRRTSRLNELLEQSHFVSLHCYLDETTYHLLDRQALARIPRGGIVLNTARGPVIDQEALLGALESGHLAGAGLDVFEREPLDDERLRHHPRVVLTPHSAFYSAEGFTELRCKAAEEVRRLLLGEAARCPVNVEVQKVASGE
ncbi:MAG: C-terminal binding protein [Isosphaeraceae bacterium]|nr:C-terminal binding protein [Isosphaeraceae bacterium]